MILLVFYCPRSLRLFTVHQGPVYAGHWAVIELYGRQYQNITGIMIVTPEPSVFSLWRYHDTNTYNDISDERQVLRVILTTCQSQRCVNTSHTSLKLSISNSASMSNVCRVLWPHIPVYAGLLVTSEHIAVMWQWMLAPRIIPPWHSREILKCLCPHYTKWILVWMQQTDLFSTRGNVECSWLWLWPGPGVTGADGTLVCSSSRSHATIHHRTLPGPGWRQLKLAISEKIFIHLAHYMCPSLWSRMMS